VIGAEIAGIFVKHRTPPLLHVHRNTGRIEWAGNRAVFIRADLASSSGRERLATIAMQHAPLAGIVLCASTFAPTPVGTLGHRTMTEILQLDLESQLILVEMLHRTVTRQGRILLFSDAGTTLGWPSHVAYIAAKAGLEAAARSLAMALGPDIIVSCLAPGPVAGASAPEPALVRDRTALGRLARAEEIARAAVAILELPASIAQGTVFVIDGGRRLFCP